MPDELHHRLIQVRQQLTDWGVDGLLITSESNRRWLSGFTGSAGLLLITAEIAILATDFRYWEQAATQAPHFTLFKQRRREKEIRELFELGGVRRIGLEAGHVTLAQSASLRAAVNGHQTDTPITFVPLKSTVEPLRQIKSAAELATIQASAKITDQVMAQVNHLAHPGMTERELAWELEKRMREAGADGIAFTLIVASGPNSALPHHRPSDRILQAGDAIVVDMGATVNDYHSDLTRTFYLGPEPDEQFWAVYNLVEAAQANALEHMKPGMTGKQIDALARGIIAAAGHGEHFGHGLGHGVGLEVHEGPSLSFRAEKQRVKAGMVATVEPGVYLPGWGGIRIEDLVVFNESGVEPLSHCPKVPQIPC